MQLHEIIHWFGNMNVFVININWNHCPYIIFCRWFTLLLRVVESSINVKENVRKCNFIWQLLTLALIPNPRKPCEDVPWPPKWILNLPWKSYLIWKSRFDMKIRMKVCHTITNRPTVLSCLHCYQSKVNLLGRLWTSQTRSKILSFS